MYNRYMKKKLNDFRIQYNEIVFKMFSNMY